MLLSSLGLASTTRLTPAVLLLLFGPVFPISATTTATRSITIRQAHAVLPAQLRRQLLLVLGFDDEVGDAVESVFHTRTYFGRGLEEEHVVLSRQVSPSLRSHLPLRLREVGLISN